MSVSSNPFYSCSFSKGERSVLLNDKQLSGKEVRLFPSHHIKSDREAELRATASLLAVVCSVSEFGRAIVSIAGGPKGKIRSYAEVPFKTQNGTKFCEERPDGILRSTFGKKDWTAFVEVKVGNNFIEQEQFLCYHALACENEIDALITISNQAALADGVPPGVKPDARQLKRCPSFISPGNDC